LLKITTGKMKGSILLQASTPILTEIKGNPQEIVSSQQYETLLDAVLGISDTYAAVIIPWVGIMIAFRLGFNYIGFLTDGSRELDFKTPILHLGIIFFLMNYSPIMRNIDGTVNSIILQVNMYNFVPDSQKDSDTAASVPLFGAVAGGLEGGFKKAMATLTSGMSKQKAAQIAEAQAKSQTAETLGGFLGAQIEEFVASIPDFTTMIDATGAFFTGGIISSMFAFIRPILWVLRQLIELASFIIPMVLLPLGVLAALFTAVPGIADKSLKKWFTSWLGIKMWMVTVTVQDFILYGFVESWVNLPAEDFGADFGGMIWGTAACLFFIGLYMAIPLLTSYYIYYEGASLLSKGLAGISTIASALVSLKTGGMGGGLAAGTLGKLGGSGGGSGPSPSEGNRLGPQK
jgi:hypothetical protein